MVDDSLDAKIRHVISRLRDERGLGSRTLLAREAAALIEQLDALRIKATLNLQEETRWLANAERQREVAPNLPAYRSALMWAFDRLGVDGGMSEKEQLHIMREIGNVLCGRRSPAATYEPNDWDSSAKLPVKNSEK